MRAEGTAVGVVKRVAGDGGDDAPNVLLQRGDVIKKYKMYDKHAVLMSVRKNLDARCDNGADTKSGGESKI
jgi:hypothetical protein